MTGVSLLRLCLCLLLVTACGEPDPPKIKIAVSLVPGLHGYQELQQGIELALEDRLSTSGVRPVELLPLTLGGRRDNQQILDQEIFAARQAVTDPEVVAYLGPISSALAQFSMPVLNRAGVVQISPSATWPGLTLPGFAPGEPGVYYPEHRRHFFRVVPTDDLQGALVARWIHRLGFERLVLMDDGSAYGIGLAGIIEVAVRDLGLENVTRASGSLQGDRSVGSDRLVGEVVAYEPDLLYVGAGANRATLRLLKRIRERMPDLQLMGSDALMRQEVVEFSRAVDGLYVTTPAWLDLESASTRGRTFQERYRERFNRPALPVAASSYEAMQVLLLAIDRAERPDRGGVLAAMRQLGEIDGVLGSWHFRAGGDTSLSRISGLQLRDGDWHFVETLH